MNTSTENIVCVDRVTKKKLFEQLTVGAGSPVRRRCGRQKVLIPECDLTGRRVTVDLLPDGNKHCIKN